MGNGSATAGNKVNLTIFGDPKHNNSMIIFFNFCMREKQKEKKKQNTKPLVIFVSNTFFGAKSEG